MLFGEKRNTTNRPSCYLQHRDNRTGSCGKSVAAWRGDLETLAGAPLPSEKTLIPSSLLPLCTWHKGLGVGGTGGPHRMVWGWWQDHRVTAASFMHCKTALSLKATLRMLSAPRGAASSWEEKGCAAPAKGFTRAQEKEQTSYTRQ